jgi:hypothetical protein
MGTMLKLNLQKAAVTADSVRDLAKSLRAGASADSPRGDAAPWRQFRAGMAMCIG